MKIVQLMKERMLKKGLVIDSVAGKIWAGKTPLMEYIYL